MEMKNSRLLVSEEDDKIEKESTIRKIVGIIYKIIKYIIAHICLSIILNSTRYKDLIFVDLNQKLPPEKENNMKVALCTMGKLENRYANEFVEYHLKLGIHIFIYDDNDPNTERIIDVIDEKSKPKVTTYENIKDRIKIQDDAFTECYKNNMNEYDWFLMVDMDEFLFIKNDTLKHYLSNQVFDKCDCIKLHWVFANDNGLIHYEPKPLFERFKPPYIKNLFLKTIIKTNITDMLYAYHSAKYAPTRNVTCTNTGEIVDTSKNVRIELSYEINVEKAFIIHFRYKTVDEFVIKYKRGYSDWFGDTVKELFDSNIYWFLLINKLSWEKINIIEKGLNISLTKYKITWLLRELFFMNE